MAKNLLAMAVGIKQKQVVDAIAQKVRYTSVLHRITVSRRFIRIIPKQIDSRNRATPTVR